MSDYTPTTQEVRTSYGAAVTFPTMSLPERRRAFDRWLEQVKAGAWDEGKRAGLRQSDWEHGDTATRYVAVNPYRQTRETEA